MGSQTQELIGSSLISLQLRWYSGKRMGQLLIENCTKQQLSPRSRAREWRMEISVFGRSAPEKRGGPKMSFASWLSINHASAPSFRPETDRRADRGARDRDRPGRRRRSPPRPSPSPPPSLSFVAKGKRKPSSSTLRPPNRRLVQIGNEAQGLARPPLTSLHFGCFCEPFYLGHLEEDVTHPYSPTFAAYASLVSCAHCVVSQI